MTMRRLIGFSVVPIFLLIVSCVHKESKSPDSPSEQIAYAGHGMLFDKSFKEITLTPELIRQIQDSTLDEISKVKRPNAEAAAQIQQAQKILSDKLISAEEAVLLKGAIINKHLQDASTGLKAKYDWRNKLILSKYWHLVDPQYQSEINPAILARLKELGFFDLFKVRDTNYMADCRTHNVPIPPDWAESGTAWRLQGTLTQNILQPNGFAAVWTYSDPGRRGACIALPRGSGAPGSVAGIICQSATTGHACFWDNKLRSNPGSAIGWSGKRLVINDLVDGSNLVENCTGCHRGNNVYLISPDDATWRKVLRGPLNGGSTGTFTTRVESSSDNRGGHPRYIPITTLPDRPGWENGLPSNVCSSACHEQPVVNAPQPMPPVCGNSGCYGTP